MSSNSSANAIGVSKTVESARNRDPAFIYRGCNNVAVPLHLIFRRQKHRLRCPVLDGTVDIFYPGAERAVSMPLADADSSMFSVGMNICEAHPQGRKNQALSDGAVIAIPHIGGLH